MEKFEEIDFDKMMQILIGIKKMIDNTNCKVFVQIDSYLLNVVVDESFIHVCVNGDNIIYEIFGIAYGNSMQGVIYNGTSSIRKFAKIVNFDQLLKIKSIFEDLYSYSLDRKAEKYILRLDENISKGC